MSLLRAHSVHEFGDLVFAGLRTAVGAEVAVTVGPELPGGAAVDVLIAGRPTPTQLAACPGLRAVIVPWAGISAATLDCVAERPGVALHNLHHNAGPTAEHALTLLLAAAKNVVASDRRMRAHDWKDRGRAQTAVFLAGERAVVVGMGAIGTRIAALCRGLGMDVVGVARAVAPNEERDGVPVVAVDRLRDVLTGARALLVAVPLTGATRGLIGASELALLGDAAVVVNIARGPVIDERALYEGLRDGRLHGAGLDVWYRYPQPDEERTAPSEFPFEDLANVVMTPHRAGSTDATERLRMNALAEILTAFARGEAPPNRVDPQRGY